MRSGEAWSSAEETSGASRSMADSAVVPITLNGVVQRAMDMGERPPEGFVNRSPLFHVASPHLNNRWQFPYTCPTPPRFDGWGATARVVPTRHRGTGLNDHNRSTGTGAARQRGLTVNRVAPAGRPEPLPTASEAEAPLKYHDTINISKDSLRATRAAGALDADLRNSFLALYSLRI